MAKRRVANPLAFAVLGSLNERPMHPYEISTILRARGKDQSIKLNYGSLYSVVGALEKHGLIEARETVREGNRPERTIYGITEAGRAEFEDWLTELLGTPVREYSQLEAGLAYLPGLSPSRVIELLEQRGAALQATVAELETLHASPELKALPRLFLVESEYRLAMLRAELAYVTELATEIRDGTLDGVRFWRRGYELAEAGQATLGEMIADPERYLGEEGDWLKQLPRESL
jgi:DNA-binding PadR family transcriptional regulator